MSRHYMMCAPLALVLFLAAVVPSQGQNAEAGAGGSDAGEVLYYDVGYAIHLNCNVTNPDNAQIVWKKNGTLVSEWADVSGRVRYEGAGGSKLVIPVKSHEDDYGNYTCTLPSGGAGRAWQVKGRPHSKLPANTNVVEGQKLKLQCRVFGKPYTPVTWMYVNASNAEDANASSVPALQMLGSRASVQRSEQGVEDAALLIEVAERSDAGRYYCVVGEEEQYNGSTVLRVKDMYAALWPFLGICAEVLILCVIILVYEKRRTKPELDDSDTDNHDQKKS